MEELVRIDRCNNIGDFRSMARRRLPGPIFHYIDGAADDEVTYRRNTEAYQRCDLVPNVLTGVESIDMSITVVGQKIGMPLFCAPTALQRLFHHEGERAVAKAAEKFGTMLGASSLGIFLVAERVLQKFLRESRTGAFGARDHLQELASRLGIPLRRSPEHASNQGLHRRHFSDLVAFANRDRSRRLIQSDDVQTAAAASYGIGIKPRN